MSPARPWGQRCGEWRGNGESESHCRRSPEAEKAAEGGGMALGRWGGGLQICLGFALVGCLHPRASLTGDHLSQAAPPSPGPRGQEAGDLCWESSHHGSAKLLSAPSLPHPVFSAITHIPGSKDARKSCKDHSFLIKLSSQES